MCSLFMVLVCFYENVFIDPLRFWWNVLLVYGFGVLHMNMFY